MKNKTYLTVPVIAGNEGNVSVIFTNATFLVENDSSKRLVDSDFGAWLIDEIYNKSKIFADRRGFLNKILICPICNTELDLISESFREVERELKYKDFPSFAIRLIIPTVVCARCKHTYGADKTGTLSYKLNNAIIDAFKSKNIKP